MVKRTQGHAGAGVLYLGDEPRGSLRFDLGLM